MFYKMIQEARDRWYASDKCTVNSMLEYIETAGMMRDAQIEAIRTYLFLKIACDSKPLPKLFSEGAFNNLDIDELELSGKTRTFLEGNPAAAALFEYAELKNEKGETISPKLSKQIRKDPEAIDYKQVINDLFYQETYTDYVFSLPMGAGKTFLMAAFIYLDMYFAKMEPDNDAFAHNFIILAPSGTKTSIIPSLRTIQKFDPLWVLPDPVASEIKRELSFEILDQNKSKNKSTQTKNPNVQKIARYQPFAKTMGLVAVTNAEKVILDRIQEKKGQVSLFEDSDDIKDRQANELRNLLGKLPHLAVFIDEVHHAATEEIKLKAVVNKWAENKSVNSVIGFSGTPYLGKAVKTKVVKGLTVATDEMSTIVDYYPLINGIGNFLKVPSVKMVENVSSEEIIDKGIREFLDAYKDTIYEGGLTAKLGIFCGTIDKCEEIVYPLARSIANEYGLNSDAVLRVHDGNKQHPEPAECKAQFAALDKPISPVRIVLLVQIGKEGWDCQSLTGVILSQENSCPKNMVLQTSCRCLRQVGFSKPGTALLYLNAGNGQILEEQLKEEQRITLKEFQTGDNRNSTIKRYDRTKYLKLPKVDFYQLRVDFETVIVNECHPEEQIDKAVNNAKTQKGKIRSTDFYLKDDNEKIEFFDQKQTIYPVTFTQWLMQIVKGSCGTISRAELEEYYELKEIFNKITTVKEGRYYFNPEYDLSIVNANIRKAFCEERDFKTTEEYIPQEASLLNIANLKSEIETTKPEDYYPAPDVVERIIKEDKGKARIDKDQLEQTLNNMRLMGADERLIEEFIEKSGEHPHRKRSYHYIPYRTDSPFEQEFLKRTLAYQTLIDLDLELYYNGDRAMTEFKIKCYKKNHNAWQYVGMYTPDFMIIKRKEGVIHKAVIVETKGAIYANDPMFKEKRKFMESSFLDFNNKKFGYKRFDYLYLEDSENEGERLQRVQDKIVDFFGKEVNDAG